MMKRREFLKRVCVGAPGLSCVGGYSVAKSRSSKPSDAPDDIIIADFKKSPLPTDWQVEGYAFGSRRPGPERQQAAKTTANQRQYQTGKLTSPEFAIERGYLVMELRGTYHPERCCVALVIDGRDVRRVSPGEYGNPSPSSMDVHEFLGKKARLEVRDDHFNGWVELGRVFQTDKPKGGAQDKIPAWESAVFQTKIDGAFLLLPVDADTAPLQTVTIEIDGQEKLAADMPLAMRDAANYQPVYDLTGHQGKMLRVSYHQTAKSRTEQLIRLSPDIPGHEASDSKPAFHVHCRFGRLNDPNGLVYHDGQYHLFHQYYYGLRAKHWAHYESKDLVYWQERPIGLFPDETGSMHSGSAAVDVMNTSGWQKGDIPPVIAAYTASRGMGGSDKIQMQGIAYSVDGGKTFAKYEGNPVVGKSQVFAEGSDHARDPKIFWFSPTEGRRDPYAKDGYWVMVLFEGTSHAIYTSKDLKKWERHGGVEGFHECPELFPLAIDPSSSGDSDATGSDPNNVRWVMYGANGEYHIGTFDGKSYKPETDKKIKMNYGRPFYAAQTFNNTPIGPDGQPRRIQVGWQGSQISIATELTLKKTPLGLRVCMLPVKEISNLYTRSENLDGTRLLPDSANPLATFDSGLYDIDLVANLSTAKQLELDIRGHKLVYDVESSTLAFLKSKLNLPVAKKLTLRIVIDNLSTDIFAGKDGLFHIPNMIPGGQKSKALSVAAKNGVVIFQKLRVHDLKSIWEK